MVSILRLKLKFEQGSLKYKGSWCQNLALLYWRDTGNYGHSCRKPALRDSHGFCACFFSACYQQETNGIFYASHKCKALYTFNDSCVLSNFSPSYFQQMFYFIPNMSHELLPSTLFHLFLLFVSLISID